MATRDRLLIPLVALLATLPLLLHGASCGHDLDFHLLSWQEAATQFAHGNLHPRWAVTPAFGAGEPRFVFYPPLSWTIGALLTLLVQHLQPLAHLLPHSPDPAQLFAAVPLAYAWLCLSAVGFGMLHLARRFLPPNTALLVATLYLANPYTLFTAYERTAFAELLAAAWLPLLLAAILPSAAPTPNTPSTSAAPSPNLPSTPNTPPSLLPPTIPSTNRPPAPTALPATAPDRPLAILPTALPLALLWLTNAPAAVIGSYTLALVVLLRLIHLARRPATRPHLLPLAVRSAAATLLGLALAAFYIVPAVLERPWVQIGMAVLPGMRPDDNTLFHQTSDPDHDAVLHTASLLAVLLLAITLVALLLSFTRTRKKYPAPLPILAILTLLIGIFLTNLSLPLWHSIPQLAFLQFPWRLLALLAVLAPLAVGLALPTLPRRLLLVSALLLPCAAILPAYNNFHQECDPDDTPAARFALFHSPRGDDPTDEYTPASADNDSLHHNNPPYQLLSPTNDDTATPSTALPGPAPLTLHLHLPQPAVLVLNLRDYPTWLVLLNQHPDPDRDHRSDGLLAVPLPAGIDEIQLQQRTPATERAADALSAFTLFGTLVTLARSRRTLSPRLAR